MKTKILMTACIAIILSTGIFANPNPEQPETTRTIKLAKNFYSLSLTNVKVILTNGDASEIYITGDEAAAKNIEIQTAGSQLKIDGTDLTQENDVTLYISAQLLNKIELYGKSEVTSTEVLINPKLDFVVSDDYKVKITTAGKINVVSGDGYDFKYEYRKLKGTHQAATILAHP